MRAHKSGHSHSAPGHGGARGWDVLLTCAESLERLRAFVERHGTQQQAAAAIHVSPQYLSDVLNERRDPAHILGRIGLRRVVMYDDAPPQGNAA